MDGKRMGFLRYAKAGGAALIVAACVGLAGCAHRAAVDSWGDSGLAAEQRAEIRQLRRDVADMGEYQRQVSDGIDRATERIERGAERLLDGIQRAESIEGIFREVDEFVRFILEENRQLRELQHADSGADAGAR